VTWDSDTDLARLIERFHAATLPAGEWTHHAHLAVGTWHVYHHGADAALDLMRAGILRLNEHHGTPNTDTRGYHETITRAYLLLIGEVLARIPRTTPAAAVSHVLQDSIASAGVLLHYYARDTLMSVAARREWVEPDRQPLT
jgi:hypothetical protein